MRILFYLRIVVMGGAERYLLTLLPELKKRNIEVGFFCTEQQNNKEIIEYFTNHFALYDIPVYRCKASSTFSLKAAKSLSKIIKKGNYNILSCHLTHAEIVSVLSKVLFKNSCKLVITKHGYLQKFMDTYGLDYSKINKLNAYYQLMKLLQRFADDSFAVSKGLADFFEQTGLCKPNQMKVIYHGIEDNITKSQALPIKYTNNQVLIIGRLRKIKGHHFLIEAIKLLSKEIPDIKLVILGKGEEMDNLVKMVDNYNLKDFVVFAGYSDNVYEYITGSDIVVAPSLAEAFGLIVLEAYNCAKPVIAFNVPALNENIIDNKTGCLATPYSIFELAQKIKYLLQNKDIAQQFGLQGKALLKDKFSLNESITQTINFYNQLN